MLVEINLLPRRHPRSYGFILSLVSLALIAAFVLAFTLWSWDAKRDELAATEKRIQTQQELRAAEELKKESLANSSSAIQLNRTIDWAENYEVKTVPLLQHLISLLPERGYIITFESGDDGKIMLATQFDTSREAAFYLNELSTSKWLKNVRMTTLSTKLGKVNALTGEDVSNKESDDKSKLDNDTYVPRYAAVYELFVNQEGAKKEAAKEAGKKNLPAKKGEESP
ncbi:PilN domain-containing protein [Peribacillus sp. SCS-37]|uniref:PilN domain-containing protein n=1 Tax=Paraperibacillus esterisolvens TaxID=3115296 RepID=UPI00390660B6